MNRQNMEGRKNTKPVAEDRLNYSGIRGLNDKELIRNLISPFSIEKEKEDAMVLDIIRVLDKNMMLKFEHLTNIPGVTHSMARLILSALESGRRWPARKQRQIRTPEDAYNEVRHYADRPQEHLIVVAINGAHEIMFTEVVSIGTVNMSYAHPREIFSNAVRNRATGIILAHNHPSNILKVSTEDAALTKRILACGQILGITVLDHLIISESGYISLKTKGIIP